MVEIKREEVTINADGEILGRLASRIAVLLRGKNRPDFAYNKDIGGFVTVKNAAGIKLTKNKAEQKKYYHHSGYPGGIKEISFKDAFKDSPAEVLKKAVWGMMAKNRLRKNQIKRLKILNEE